MNYEIRYTLPLPSEWQYLRSYSDWEIFSETVFETAAKKSIFGVSVYDKNEIIGMGRIVGDGIICFYIQDVIVSDKYRNKHIGTIIVNILLSYIKQNAEKGATIALFSHKGTESFYERFGFLVREKNGKGSGMYMPYSIIKEFQHE